MRRKDRELTPEQAWEIVDQCSEGVVAMMDEDGAPYAVPVNLVREENRMYFHSAMAGKKTDCLRGSPRVCVTCVERGAEIDQPGLTTRYASAILTGTAADVIDTKCACWLCYFAACAWGVDSYLVSMTSDNDTK